MADPCYLEKMGRELKCPICLSLLDSAMSLTCNHVFCNSCIHKSMRAGSNCPVCKVHYQRREIRPAPHMDNLVNIYKSMEVASGLNIFITQNPPAINSSDVEKQVEGDGDARVEETGVETPQTKRHQTKKGKMSKALSRSKQKNSGRNRRKPSYRTNKRVQVPQSPITETPVRQAMQESRKNKIINNVGDYSSDLPSEHPPSNGTGCPLFQPFFWLREEDVDKSSQRTDVDHLTGTPVKAPSFSDIKDSDDDVPSNGSPNEGLLRKCNNGDFFDSEIFEWTQRACSPELCSTPIQMQVGNSGKFDGMEIQEVEAPSNGDVTNSKVITEDLDSASHLAKISTGSRKLHKSSSPGRKVDHKGSLKRKTTKTDQQKKNAGQVGETLNSSEMHDGSIQNSGCNPQGISETGCPSNARHLRLIDSKLLKEVDDSMPSELTTSNSKKGYSEVGKFNNSVRNLKRIRQGHGVESVKGKKLKSTLAKSDAIEEFRTSQGGRHEDVTLNSNFSMELSVGKVLGVSQRSTCCKTKRSGNRKRCGMRNIVTKTGVCCQNGVDKSNEAQIKTARQVESENVQGAPQRDHRGGPFAKGKVHFPKNMPTLHKCDAIPIKCSFCQSAEETELSGEMVHYSEGKPVSEEHQDGHVVHSHKNCTEWAPNIYFEDDIAVNLEEELTRSRRIKCFLCGKKGAALGCYEKSCRKSFHVPCAKLLRECRWDADHFVILCPLHASLKLPCELPSSQVKKVKSNLKGKFLNQQSQVAAGHGTKTNLWNRGRSSEKLVLCCSGLAPADKETVYEFAKSSGVVISTTWNPSATHVIASMDENEACKRTLKVLMGILDGKWIVSIKWVQACLKAMKLVEEAPYEINCDIHGVKNGPHLGRLRLLNKEPKLFAGFKFYFSGDFVPSYKGYLQDLITAAGGTVLHRKPIAETDEMAASLTSIPPTIIVYSIELPDKCDLSKKHIILERRQSEAEALASLSGSNVANNSWVLDCIAGHKLQDF